VSKRTARGQLRTILALLTIATLLAMPFSAFGAKGTGLAAELTTLTEKASVGGLLAFEVSFTNSGSSAIQHFRFDGRVSPAASASFASGTDPCAAGPSSNEVTCLFGSLPAGGEVNLLLLFTANATGKATFTGEFSGDARTGTPGKKQDVWATDAKDGAYEVFATGEFFGGWITNPSGGLLATIGSTQVTTLHVPSRDKPYAVALGHSNANIKCGNTTYTGYGLAVELSVANGQSPVAMEIKLARQPGLSASNVKIVHQSDDGTCTFPPKVAGCLLTGPAECYDAYTIGTGANQQVVVDAKFKSNGRAKNF
jgi:hypothetical protein